MSAPPPKVRFTVLQSGEIDVLIRDSTLTFTRDTQLGLAPVAVNFYAGQGFMVRKSLGVDTAREARRRHDLHGHRRDARAEHRRLRALATARKIGSLLFEQAPRRRSPPPRPAAATATPTTPAASRPRGRR